MTRIIGTKWSGTHIAGLHRLCLLSECLPETEHAQDLKMPQIWISRLVTSMADFPSVRKTIFSAESLVGITVDTTYLPSLMNTSELNLSKMIRNFMFPSILSSTSHLQ
jgi:hypothetical protein